MIAKARHDLEQRLRPLIGPIRECQQWRLEAPGEPWVVRWDFKFKDPSTGKDLQYGVESYFADQPEQYELDHGADFARDMIARMLVKKCGDKFLPPDYPMRLPSVAVKARWV